MPILPVWFDDPLDDYRPIGQWFDEQFDTGIAGPTVYPLDVTVGAFALAGTTTVLQKASILVSTVGTFSLAGTTTGLSKQFTLGTTLGTFTLSGTNSLLQKASRLDVTAGTYSVVGNNLILSPFAVLNVNAGSFTLAGTSTVLGRQSSLNVTTGSFTVGSSSLSSSLFFILNGLNVSYNLGSSSTSLLLTRRIDGSVLNLSLFQIPAELVRRFPLNLQPSAFNVQGTGLDYFATRILNASSLGLLIYVQTRDIVYRPNRQPLVPTAIPRGRNQWVLGKFTSGGKGSFRV